MKHICILSGLFAGTLWLGSSTAQTYVSFEPPNDDANLDGAHRLIIYKNDGSIVVAPTLPGQVGFSDMRISDDGTRVGWLVLDPNVSYPIPLHLVVFSGDKIERVFDGKTCLMRWSFGNNGASVAYFEEPLHFSTSKGAELRDIASGKLLAEYGLQRVDGEILPDDLKRAPQWVQEIPDIGR